MRLVLTTPQQSVLALEDVLAVHAEDSTGRFTILPGHADFVTVLAVAVLGWRQRSGAEGQVAVRGGVFVVRGGREVSVASRQVVVERAPGELGTAVLADLAAEEAAERAARLEATRLELATWRRLRRYLAAGHGPAPRRNGEPWAGDGAPAEASG